MKLFANLCEASGDALNEYVAAHGPGKVLLNNDYPQNVQRAECVSSFLETLSEKNAKFHSVFDGFDDFNPDVGGRVFVKSARECAGIYVDSEAEFAMVSKFLENVDAFAFAAEDNPDGLGVVLTVDWRVENVKF